LGKLIRIFIAFLAVIFLFTVSINSLQTVGYPLIDSSTVLEKKVRKLNRLVTRKDTTGAEVLPPGIDALPIKDSVYDYSGALDSVVVMYVTVRTGSAANGTNHTFDEINGTQKFNSNTMQEFPGLLADAIFQVGDEKGPLLGDFGYGETTPNATITTRGHTSSFAPQKSYKIKLNKTGANWRGQRIIALNKQYFDISRVAQKLSFDLMQDIPNMLTLHTQFVHLYIKDETENPPDKTFEDYGLFTQVEEPDNTFLKNDLLEYNGNLYKAQFFEFNRYPDNLRLTSDPLYNAADFSSILENHSNNTDNSKLLQMLDDVNNPDIPIQTTFTRYFDSDNYFTWMAFNILVGNLDTNAQNFYLYSPEDNLKWYFIPWDYDGAFSRQINKTLGATFIHPWSQGISNYWNVILHQRVLKVPEYRQMLDEKVNELMQILTPERIKGLLNSYRKVTDIYITRNPDLSALKLPLDTYYREMDMIPNEPQLNYQLYRESLEQPMPFYLGTPQNQGSTFQFIWDLSYDFVDQAAVVYHFQIATDWDFKNVITDELTDQTQVNVPALKPGVYFWRVIATDNTNGKEQQPYDNYLTGSSNSNYHNGMKYLEVTADGKIIEKLYEGQP
jgi:spore coat protein H